MGPWNTETGLESRDLKEKERERSSERSCQMELSSSAVWRAVEEEKRKERPPMAIGLGQEDGGHGRGLKSLSGEPWEDADASWHGWWLGGLA